MKHENDVSNMTDCPKIGGIDSFMKEIKQHISASFILILFVKSAKFKRICSRIIPNIRLGFHQDIKAWRNSFIS